MTIIDWINSILIYKKPWEEFSETHRKTFSPYIINRFLSMDEEFTEIVNMFQPYSIGMLESKDIYEFYCKLLPKGKRFNKYIKGKKEKKYNKDLIDILVKNFECGKTHIKEYLEFLSKEDLRNILIKYGMNEKTIKRLLK